MRCRKGAKALKYIELQKFKKDKNHSIQNDYFSIFSIFHCWIVVAVNYICFIAALKYINNFLYI